MSSSEAVAVEVPCGCWIMVHEGLPTLTAFCDKHLEFVFGQLAPTVRAALSVVTAALITVATQQTKATAIAGVTGNETTNH